MLSSTDKIIVIGRDMQRLIAQKIRHRDRQIVFIPNWSDHAIHPDKAAEETMRAALGLTDKFIIQYSGNIGRTHDVDTLLEAAQILKSRNNNRVHWMFCGWEANFSV